MVRISGISSCPRFELRENSAPIKTKGNGDLVRISGNSS